MDSFFSTSPSPSPSILSNRKNIFTSMSPSILTKQTIFDQGKNPHTSSDIIENLNPYLSNSPIKRKKISEFIIYSCKSSDKTRRNTLAQCQTSAILPIKNIAYADTKHFNRPYYFSIATNHPKMEKAKQSPTNNCSIEFFNSITPIIKPKNTGVASEKIYSSDNIVKSNSVLMIDNESILNESGRLNLQSGIGSKKTDNMSLSNSKKKLDTTKKLNRKKLFRSVDAINQISNFYDKMQINTAIAEIGNTNEKVKMLDLILKKREEIKLLEDKEKFERVMPALKKFTDGVKSRLIVKNNLIRDNASRAVSINQSKSDVKINSLDMNHASIDDHDHETHALCTPVQSNEAKLSRILAKNHIESLYTKKPDLKLRLMPKHYEEHDEYASSDNSLSKSNNNDDDDNDNHNHYHNIKNKKFKINSHKHQDLSNNHIETARKTVVEDIYKYLIKNNHHLQNLEFFLDEYTNPNSNTLNNINSNNNNTNCALTINNNKTKDKSYNIKIIEANVKEKIDQHKMINFKNLYRPIHISSNNKLRESPKSIRNLDFNSGNPSIQQQSNRIGTSNNNNNQRVNDNMSNSGIGIGSSNSNSNSMNNKNGNNDNKISEKSELYSYRMSHINKNKSRENTKILPFIPKK